MLQEPWRAVLDVFYRDMRLVASGTGAFVAQGGLVDYSAVAHMATKLGFWDVWDVRVARRGPVALGARRRRSG